MDYNARWYAPYLKSFTAPDSIVPDPYNPQDYNRYAYTRNNPVKYIDPSGHDPWWCDGDNCQSRYNESMVNNKDFRLLKQELDHFDKVPTYSKKELTPYTFFSKIPRLASTQNFNPSEWETLQDLNDIEFHEFGILSRTARKHAESSLFPYDQKAWGDGPANAFQHAYWSAQLTQEFGGDFALAVTTSHEMNPDAVRETQFMDLYNNGVGINIASENMDASPSVLFNLVYQAVRNGNMVVLEPSGKGFDIYFSNSCPSCSIAYP